MTKHRATYQDVIDAPENLVAEILMGELHLSPRPAPAHAVAGSAIGISVGAPFYMGSGGPGGWWILDEPELWLGPPDDVKATVVVPDVAGWRRERLPSMPETVGFTVPPDWACEVISPSSVRRDRVLKRAIYADAGVPWLWLVDPVARLVEALRLGEDGHYAIVGSWSDGPARIPPFDAVPLPVGEWWAGFERDEGT